jgi:hypothetical protein
MPRLYHGTSRVHALTMRGAVGGFGAIDVTLGGGEFGRGFYTQESISNAHRRGYLTYGRHGAVLVVDIDDDEYHALQFLRLGLNAAQKLNARLHGAARNTYLTADDVIVGPLVTLPQIEQQKFQSERAEDLLNGPHTQRLVI